MLSGDRIIVIITTNKSFTKLVLSGSVWCCPVWVAANIILCRRCATQNFNLQKYIKCEFNVCCSLFRCLKVRKSDVRKKGSVCIGKHEGSFISQ